MKKDSLKKDNQKFNIFINNDPDWGGTYQYTELIVKALKLKIKKDSLKIYYTKKIWKKDLKQKDIYLEFSFIQLILIQILVFFHAKYISRLLAKFKILNLPKNFFKKDQVWVFPSQDIISTICGGKTIVSINDLMHRYTNFPETSSILRRIYRDYLFKKIAKQSYRVLVDSKLGKKHVEECYGYNNNIRIQYFSTLIQVNKKLSQPVDKYIIYPAQFWEHKNHINLVYAINVIKKKFGDIKLILIGHKKREYNKIFKLVSKLDLKKNIKFLGYVNNNKKISLIQNARALINPSLLGPTNIPQVEAFFCGCPVIVANIFASKEQCSNGAIYFNPNDYYSIATSIEKIWNSDKLYRLYKKKSLKKANDFSFEKFSSQLLRNFF
jgi:glycosyltransferase involved in cell wall biosynthesis